MLELFARTSGTWINVAAIAAGTAVGVGAGARLPERLGRTLMQVLGLVTLFVGLGMARGLDGVRSGPLPGRDCRAGEPRGRRAGRRAAGDSRSG